MFKYIKRNTQFSFLQNPPKSGASRVCINFPQTAQKILTKDTFHRLELITEILSFLHTFDVGKTTTQFFFLIFQKIYKKINKKRLLQIILAATYIALSLPDSNNCFFYIFSAIYPYLPLLICHSVFLFSPFLFLFSLRDTFCNSQCFIRFHYI